MSLGKSIAAIEVVITNEAGERVATGQLACLLRDWR